MQRKSDYFKTNTESCSPAKHDRSDSQKGVFAWYNLPSCRDDMKINNSCSHVRSRLMNCVIKALIWFLDSLAFRWHKNLTATRSVSSVRRRVYTCSARAGDSGRSRWSERAKANNPHNSVPSSVSAIRITICSSSTSTTANSTARPRRSSSPTPTRESTLCWA